RHTRFSRDWSSDVCSSDLFFAFMWAHPGKQLLFMGGEFGQEREWAESRELDWPLLEQPDRAGLQHLVADLNRSYRLTPALWRLEIGRAPGRGRGEGTVGRG